MIQNAVYKAANNIFSSLPAALPKYYTKTNVVPNSLKLNSTSQVLQKPKSPPINFQNRHQPNMLSKSQIHQNNLFQNLTQKVMQPPIHLFNQTNSMCSSTTENIPSNPNQPRISEKVLITKGSAYNLHPEIKYISSTRPVQQNYIQSNCVSYNLPNKFTNFVQVPHQKRTPLPLQPCNTGFSNY